MRPPACAGRRCACKCGWCGRALLEWHSEGLWRRFCTAKCQNKAYKASAVGRAVRSRSCKKRSVSAIGRRCEDCGVTDKEIKFGPCTKKCSTCWRHEQRKGRCRTCASLLLGIRSHCPACPGPRKAPVVLIHPRDGREKTIYLPISETLRRVTRSKRCRIDELVLDARTPRAWALGEAFLRPKHSSRSQARG